MSNSTKTITNTRIQIKRGTEAEWSTKSSFAPLEGEIILYSDLNKIKVGKKDNEGNLVLLADLPFIHVDKDEVDNFEHTHNDLYYTKSEVQSVISEKLGESTIDAEDVKFSTDLQFTKSFGKYVPDSTGSVIIPTKTNDMSLKTLLLDAFSEELNPKTTQPNLTIKASEMTSYEVGSVVEVDFELTTTTGSYTYGPATGVTWSNYSATFNGQTIEASSGTFAATTVGDTTNLTISATAKHSAGATPKTNLGNNFIPATITSTSGAIQENTDTATSSALTGYRKMFFGTLTTKPETMVSSDIRALTGISEKASTCTEKALAIPVDAYRVAIAVPVGKTLSAVLDVNDSNANIVGSFKSTIVNVEGANGYTGTDYNVYYLDYANANNTANTYKVTII